MPMRRNICGGLSAASRLAPPENGAKHEKRAEKTKKGHKKRQDRRGKGKNRAEGAPEGIQS
jgi:hypothetical protein